MRIAFIHQTFSKANAEGSGRANDMAAYLAKRGHTVTVVAGANSYLSGEVPAEYKKKFVVKEEHDGYRIMRTWSYGHRQRGFFHRYLNYLSFFCSSIIGLFVAGPVDVYVAGSPPLTALVGPAIVALIKRKPLILEIRDLWPKFPIEMGIITSPAAIKFLTWMERWLYKQAVIIVVNSPGFIPHMIESGVAPSRIRVIPNGVDTEVFRPVSSDKDLKQQLNMAGKFVVLYIGAHGPANNLYVLLSAANLLKNDSNIVFLLVGDGKEKKQLRQFAHRHGLTNVVFLDPQSKDQMPRLISIADVCFASLLSIPAFVTTYPNKIFDYMACSKPIVSTIDGVSREVIDNSRGGVYVSCPEEIADAIKEFRNDPSSFGFNPDMVRRFVVDKFDRRIFLKAFEDSLDFVNGMNS